MDHIATVVTRRPEQGFDIVVLTNDAVEIAVAPQLGAKVFSLRNQKSGREWLYRPPGDLRLHTNVLGDDFATSTMLGWDECLPSIAPCEWAGRCLPDHGEVWSAPWTVDEAALRTGILTTAAQLCVTPFVFTRSLRLRGATVLVRYSLENKSDRPEAYLWAMHPLLAIEPGDCLELPPGVRDQLGHPAWVDSLEFPDGPGCAKVFARPLTAAWGGVYNARTGDRVRLHWESAANNTLGLWLTRGGWNGHHHVAIEPTNGQPDSLAAAQPHRCGWLPPRTTKSWNVQIRLEP